MSPFIFRLKDGRYWDDSSRLDHGGFRGEKLFIRLGILMSIIMINKLVIDTVDRVINLWALFNRFLSDDLLYYKKTSTEYRKTFENKQALATQRLQLAFPVSRNGLDTINMPLSAVRGRSEEGGGNHPLGTCFSGRRDVFF